MSATVEQASAIAQILDFVLKYVLIPVITAGLSGVVVYKKAEKKFHQKQHYRCRNVFGHSRHGHSFLLSLHL
jgi:hypothetical protein